MPETNENYLNSYNEYLDKIYNYIWYRVGFDRVIAEDLCSEVFIKAYKSYDSFDESRSFQSWIYAIAKNHLSNHYRSRGREVSLDSVFDFSVDTLSKINLKLEVESLLKIVSELDEYSREVIVLRYVDGLDNKEIAELLNKDVNTVRVQLSRALEKLRKKIK